MQLISTTKPFSILRPVASPYKPDVDQTDILTRPTRSDAIFDLDSSDVLVIDLETKGVSVADPDMRIVGVGLSWRIGTEVHARYFNYSEMTDDARYELWTSVSTAPCAIAHNLLFDGAHVWREVQRIGRYLHEPQWAYCTLGLYKQLASESFPQQQWGLKSAQMDLLHWGETNEAGIDGWLIEHGYVKQGPKKLEGETQEEYASRVGALIADEGKEYRPDKGEMWRCPPEVLGEYCILDCLSTLQLFDEVLAPALARFPELDEYHRTVFVVVDRLLWTQQFTGIRVDMDKLRAHGTFLKGKMQQAETQMRDGPLGPFIAQLEATLLAGHMEKEPPQHKKLKLGAEPPKFKKDGGLSKNWEKWFERSEQEPEVRKDWIEWTEKLARIKAGEIPAYRFNPASVAQLRGLVYDSGLVNWKKTDRTSWKKGKEIPLFEIEGIHGWVDLQGTDGGELPMNGDLFSQLPAEIGGPLQLYADAEQELGYTTTYIEEARQSETGEWRIHPGWVNPGTKTGRLAGKDPNLQQIPKTVEFMECLIADPECVWVEKDWSALEPHVLAELSRDQALLDLYGPGAQPHDVYLYSGAHYAVLGPQIREHYDPRSVTKEIVSKAKKLLKSVREACKVVVLAKSYGAGAKKIWSGLRLKGFKLTLKEAEQISESHDTMYADSGKKFHDILETEWEARGGWVLSGLGHPVCMWEGLKKDLINRVVQKTGHDIHMMYIVDIDRRLAAEGIPYKGIVWDFHDQLIFQVPTEYGPRCLEILAEADAALNEALGAYVKLKGDPKLCTDMAKAKEAEFSWREKEAA